MLSPIDSQVECNEAYMSASEKTFWRNVQLYNVLFGLT